MTSRRRMLSVENLTSKGVINGEIQDDWDQIVRICQSGRAQDFYSIGDWKTLNLGSLGTIKMGLANFNVDVRSDGKGFAPTSWMNLNPLKSYYGADVSYSVNTDTGWSISTQRTSYNETIYESIPEAVRNNVLMVRKQSPEVIQRQSDRIDYVTYGFSSYTQPVINGRVSICSVVSNDKIWRPSTSELLLKPEDGGIYRSFFKNIPKLTFYGETNPVYFYTRDFHYVVGSTSSAPTDITYYSGYYISGTEDSTGWCTTYATGSVSTAYGAVFGFCL